MDLPKYKKYKKAVLTQQQYIYSIEGKIYISSTEAGKDQNVHQSTILDWCNSYLKPFCVRKKINRKKFKITHKTNIRHTVKSRIQTRHSKQKYIYYIRGKRYVSREQAAYFLKVCPTTIQRWCINPNISDCYRELCQQLTYFIEGKEFTSSLKAGKEFNVPHQTILYWCKNPYKPNCYRKRV